MRMSKAIIVSMCLLLLYVEYKQSLLYTISYLITFIPACFLVGVDSYKKSERYAEHIVEDAFYPMVSAVFIALFVPQFIACIPNWFHVLAPYYSGVVHYTGVTLWKSIRAVAAIWFEYYAIIAALTIANEEVRELK